MWQITAAEVLSPRFLLLLLLHTSEQGGEGLPAAAGRRKKSRPAGHAAGTERLGTGQESLAGARSGPWLRQLHVPLGQHAGNRNEPQQSRGSPPDHLGPQASCRRTVCGSMVRTEPKQEGGVQRSTRAARAAARRCAAIRQRRRRGEQVGGNGSNGLGSHSGLGNNAGVPRRAGGLFQAEAQPSGRRRQRCRGCTGMTAAAANSRQRHVRQRRQPVRRTGCRHEALRARLRTRSAASATRSPFPREGIAGVRQRRAASARLGRTPPRRGAGRRSGR